MNGPKALVAILWIWVLAFVAMVGVCCVSSPEDGVRGLQPYLEGPVDYEEAWDERPDERQVHERTDELLAEPLGMDEAVEVALLNHPDVQGEIRRVDIAEGRLRQEARITDPELELETYFATADGGVQQLEPGVMFDVAWLFDRAAHARRADAGIEASRAEAAGRLIEFITRVRAGWVDHVGAVERAGRTRELAEAAGALAESATLYYEAGNIAEDELLRFEAHAAEGRLEVLRAEERVERTRYRLHELLGVGVERDWSVPDALPGLPDQPPDIEQQVVRIAERSVEARRLDHRIEQLEATQRIERRRGWLGRLGVGAVADIEPGELQAGPAIRLELPLFDRRAPMRDAVDAERVQAEFQHQQAARMVRLEAERIEQRLEQAYEVADHYKSALLPVRRRLTDEMLRQYNAMTVSALQLLETRHEHLEAERALVDARHQFWRARIDVDHLAAGGMPRETGDFPEVNAGGD